MAIGDDDGLMVGDLVVSMAEPGPFTIVEIRRPNVVIESETGVRRVTRASAVRKVDAEPPVAR